MLNASTQFEIYELALSKLYEAPMNPSAWVEFITRFSQLIDARGGQYHLWDTTRGSMSYAATTNEYPEKAAAFYNEHLAADDPRRKLSENVPAGQWAFDHDHYDARFVDRNEVYRYLKPWEIRYSAGVRLVDAGDMLSALGLFRAPNQGHFGEFEKRWLDRVTPHIQRASKLHLRFEDLQQKSDLGMHAASSLDYPVLLVSADARIQFANVAAESLLSLPQAPVRSRFNAIACTNPSGHEKLLRAIRNAAIPQGRGHVFSVQAKIGAPSYQVVVLPIPEHSSLSAVQRSDLALVTLGLPAPGRTVDAEFLQQLFGLSHAEARVVVGLSSGASLRELADQIGISINTVRTQLQSVLAKTNTHRQTELVQLLNALPRIRR